MTSSTPFDDFLDLSAAFDTDDHEILLQRLRVTFGIHDTVHRLFQSPAWSNSGRGLPNSSIVRLTCGVPQGSVLGPELFILCTADLMSLIELGQRVFTTSICTLTKLEEYGSCRPVEIDAFSAKLSECIGIQLDAV